LGIEVRRGQFLHNKNVRLGRWGMETNGHLSQYKNSRAGSLGIEVRRGQLQQVKP
jgi:hypothetical protein